MNEQKVTNYLRKKKNLPKLKDQPCDLPSNVGTPDCLSPSVDEQLKQLRDFDLNNKFGPSQAMELSFRARLIHSPPNLYIKLRQPL
uniref:uncharacterized protein LOC100180075 isoform X2 n=1 Tax=Ciona intestinalis TaxID=7719 RepID=UPI00089DAD96|nr:uncharacterized protein LOC100180075 isoform X2 [Ciona intestinalis]|eukprot:XP_018670556.1 uncharacterized protein LOC100180075 isoform X2 [Ciona intestinalis]